MAHRPIDRPQSRYRRAVLLCAALALAAPAVAEEEEPLVEPQTTSGALIDGDPVIAPAMGRTGNASPTGATTAATANGEDGEPAPAVSGDFSTYEGRRAACLEAAWALYQRDAERKKLHPSFPQAAALFALGKTDAARAVVARALDVLEPGNKENRWIHGGNSGFHVWPAMVCYLLYRDRFGSALEQRFSRIFTHATWYQRLTTSNHKLMAAVTRNLATQVWGEAAFVRDERFPASEDVGTRFTKGDPDATRWLLDLMREVPRGGPGEYASRPYGAQNILPYLALADLSDNPQIKQQATLCYEMSLVQLAPTWLHGHAATFSTRSYPDVLSQAPWGVAALMWLYFGGEKPSLTSDYMLLAAVQNHPLPAAVVAAGSQRATPYVARSLVNSWALTTWMDRSYALFSRSPKARRPRVLGQNYPCGVMWDEPDLSKPSFLWVTCPVADDSTPGSKTNPRGIHTHGVTNLEFQVQHRGTTLSLYDVAQWRNPYVLGYIPHGYRAAINEGDKGRILLHYGSVLIAINGSAPFTWDPAGGIKAPASVAQAGDSEFRLTTVPAACAIETAHPDEFPGSDPEAQLRAFAATIGPMPTVSTTPLNARYTDRSRTVLCAGGAQEPDSVDGATVDYAAWPLLENPWMTANGDTITVKAGQDSVTYVIPPEKSAKTKDSGKKP